MKARQVSDLSPKDVKKVKKVRQVSDMNMIKMEIMLEEAMISDHGPKPCQPSKYEVEVRNFFRS